MDEDENAEYDAKLKPDVKRVFDRIDTIESELGKLMRTCLFSEIGFGSQRAWMDAL